MSNVRMMTGRPSDSRARREYRAACSSSPGGAALSKRRSSVRKSPIPSAPFVQAAPPVPAAWQKLPQPVQQRLVEHQKWFETTPNDRWFIQLLGTDSSQARRIETFIFLYVVDDLYPAHIGSLAIDHRQQKNACRVSQLLSLLARVESLCQVDRHVFGGVLGGEIFGEGARTKFSQQGIFRWARFADGNHG